MRAYGINYRLPWNIFFYGNLYMVATDSYRLAERKLIKVAAIQIHAEVHMAFERRNFKN